LRDSYSLIFENYFLGINKTVVISGIDFLDFRLTVKSYKNFICDKIEKQKLIANCFLFIATNKPILMQKVNL